MMRSVLLCSVSYALFAPYSLRSQTGNCTIGHMHMNHMTKCWTTFHIPLKETKDMYLSSYKILSKPVDEIDLHLDVSNSSGKWMYFFRCEITTTFLIAQPICSITPIMPLTWAHDLFLSILSVSKQYRNDKEFLSQYYTGSYSTFCYIMLLHFIVWL